MSEQNQKIMSIIYDLKEKIPEGAFLKLCDLMKGKEERELVLCKIAVQNFRIFNYNKEEEEIFTVTKYELAVFEPSVYNKILEKTNEGHLCGYPVSNYITEEEANNNFKFRDGEPPTYKKISKIWELKRLT